MYVMHVHVCMYVCRLSHSCTLLKPLSGMRCHLVETLLWSQVTMYYRRTITVLDGKGKFRDRNPIVCSNAAYCQIILVLVGIFIIISPQSEK